MKKTIVIGCILIIIAATLWAVDGVVLRPGLYSLPVSLVVFVEHTLAFLFMAPFLLKERAELKKLRLADWSAFLWVAVFGGVLGTMFITKALFFVQFVNLSVVVLIQKLQPVFALTLASLLLKERMPRKFFWWAVAAIIGTYFITFDSLVPNFNTGNQTALAALYALGAAFAWGSSTVFSKRALAVVNYRIGTYLRFGLTALIMFVIVLIDGALFKFELISPHQWLLFFIIVFSSGGSAMFLYYYGLKWVRASISSICELAFPLSAILLEFILRHRGLGLTQWFGVLLLFIAIYNVSLIQQRLSRPSAEAVALPN